MEKDQIQVIFDRYMSVFLHGSKSISSQMSNQLMEELSLEQFLLVRMLYQQGGVRASELAEQLFVHKSAITVKVDKLVKKGLIEKKRDEGDRRNVHLHLSEEGRDLYEAIEEKINHFVESIVRAIPEEEMEIFSNVYKKIADYLEKYEEERE